MSRPLLLHQGIKIYLNFDKLSFRCGIDGLANILLEAFDFELFEDTVFPFRSKQSNIIFEKSILLRYKLFVKVKFVVLDKEVKS
ncbi:hypothetical protein IGI37_000629 [Enterococcus sp. AZ194]